MNYTGLINRFGVGEEPLWHSASGYVGHGNGPLAGEDIPLPPIYPDDEEE